MVIHISCNGLHALFHTYVPKDCNIQVHRGRVVEWGPHNWTQQGRPYTGEVWNLDKVNTVIKP